MRTLGGKVAAFCRDLAGLAASTSMMRAVSVEGALAKIELGLCVKGRYGWQDHALELL
jgi:hypothetical protein